MKLVGWCLCNSITKSKYHVNTVEIIKEGVFYTVDLSLKTLFPMLTGSFLIDIQSTAVHHIVYSHSFLLDYKAQICYKLHKEVDMKVIKNINGVLWIWHYNQKVTSLFLGLDEAPKKMKIAISLWNVAGSFFCKFSTYSFLSATSGGRAIT